MGDNDAILNIGSDNRGWRMDYLLHGWRGLAVAGALASWATVATVGWATTAGKALDTGMLWVPVDADDLSWATLSGSPDCHIMKTYVRCDNGTHAQIRDFESGQVSTSRYLFSVPDGEGRRLGRWTGSIYYDLMNLEQSSTVQIDTKWLYVTDTLLSRPGVVQSNNNPTDIYECDASDWSSCFRGTFNKGVEYALGYHPIVADDTAGLVLADITFQNRWYWRSTTIEVAYPYEEGNLLVLKDGAICDGVITGGSLQAGYGGVGGSATIASACDSSWRESLCTLLPLNNPNHWTCSIPLARRRGSYNVRIMSGTGYYDIGETSYGD